MQKFFQWTAWAMETPKSYGLFHLLFLFIGGAIAVTGAFLLRKTNEKQNRIVLLVVGLFLIITELYKQLFYFYVVHNGESYPLWIVPFQLCSVPMYLCIFCAICKNQKINNWLYNFMFAFNLLGGAISFAEPSGLNHPYVTLTLHAYIWHMSLVFLGLYLFFSKRACNKWNEYFKGLAVFGGTAFIAQILNVSLHKLGHINMFYISPYYKNPIAIFNGWFDTIGWVGNMFLFLLALILGGAIVFYFAYMCRTLWAKRKIKIKSVEQKNT